MAFSTLAGAAGGLRSQQRPLASPLPAVHRPPKVIQPAASKHYIPKKSKQLLFKRFEAALTSTQRVGKLVSSGRLPYPKDLHLRNLTDPAFWKWDTPNGRGTGQPVGTVGELVLQLAQVVFRGLRSTYRKPYMDACSDDLEKAALMMIRRPLRTASKLLTGPRWQRSRTVCMIVRDELVQPDGYGAVNMGKDSRGNAVMKRLHNVLTYLLYGPPKPGKDCAAHRDSCRRAGKGRSIYVSLIRSPCCRSLNCINPEHLVGWQSRSKNTQTARDPATVKMKHLKHPPKCSV